MSAGDRMIERLRALGFAVPEGSKVVPTYASRSSRAAGAWVWTIQGPEGWGWSVGSQYPLRELRGPIMLSGPDRFGDHFVDPDLGAAADTWEKR